MNTTQVLLVVIAVLGIAAILLGAALALPLIRRSSAGRGARPGMKGRPDPTSTDPAGVFEPDETPTRALVHASPTIGGADRVTLEPEAATPASADRVYRIVGWAFLMAVALVAAASGLWTANLSAIVILVAITGGAVLLLQEVVPGSPLHPARRGLQALVALAFGSVLVYLTGGLESPFSFVFPLIVGAGSILARPLLALLLALAAAIAYIAGGLAGSPDPGSLPVVQLTVNLTGILLLAFAGSVIGREQRRARDAAIRLSTLDALTGLFNRTYFFSALEREIARSDRSGRAFCLVMLDLDDLKSVNDRHGHHTGDAVLRAVSEVVRSGVRKIDVAARYGGDEFVALLPETDPTGGWVLAEKIRLTVAEQGLPGLEPSPTVSVGVVSFPADGRTADALLVSADRAMYASKRGGKNRVARASNEPTMLALQPVDPERVRRGERAG